MTAAPCDPADIPANKKLMMSVDFGGVVTTVNVDDRPVHAGDKDVMLSDISSIRRGDKTKEATLTHYDDKKDKFETIEGKITGLPKLESAFNHVPWTLDDAETVKIGAYDPGPESVPFEVILSADKRVLAQTRGALRFTRVPFGIALQNGGPLGSTHFIRIWDDDDEDSEPEGIDILPMVDISSDTRQGKWEWKGAALAMEEGADAWCELPVLAGEAYKVSLTLVPRVESKGTLVIHLPLGRSDGVLEIDAATGKLNMDEPALFPAGARDSEPEPVHADKPIEVAVSVSSEEGEIFVACDINGKAAGHWMQANMGNRTVRPQHYEGRHDRIEVGGRGFAMDIRSIKVSAPEGRIRFPSELPPSTYSTVECVGRWNFLHSGAGNEFYSLASATPAALIGSPRPAASPGGLNSAALKLDGDSAGFKLDDSDQANRARHQRRTISLWFLATALDQRRYLYDEGGSLSGYTIYIENGKLIGGGWDVVGKRTWTGTWLEGPQVTPGVWHHVELVLFADIPDKSKALSLFYDGAPVGEGPGNGIGPHEAIAVGTVYKTTKSRPTTPSATPPPAAAPASTPAASTPAATVIQHAALSESNSAESRIPKKQFSGLIDEVQIYNKALNLKGIQILSGGRFEAK